MPQLHVLNNTPEETRRTQIARGLSDLLRNTGSEVRFSRHDRLLYSTDASLYQVEPVGVVVPSSTEVATRVVEWCVQNQVPLLPRGGGTSLAGQCTNHAVVMDFTPRCRAVRSVDVAARTCEVEPGIGIDELNDHLSRQKTGLFFAPDPATTRQCAIGGAIGNNAAGARSILYGRTSENVQRIEVAIASGGTGSLLPVSNAADNRLWLGPNAGATNPLARHLAAGTIDIVKANARLIRERFPRTVRRNAGYGLDMILDQIETGATADSLDLSKLLCGSEGTLAVTLGATLKLHPIPKAKGLALLAFETVDKAIDALGPILATKPSAVELLDDVVLEAARGNEQCRGYLKFMPKRALSASSGSSASDPGAILIVEYFAFTSPDELQASFSALRAALPTDRDSIVTTTDASVMARAWALRKAGEPLLHGMPGPRKPITFVEDNAVPPERLGEFVREFRQIVSRHGTRAAYWAHASVGVLHVRPMIDIHDPADRERLRSIAVEVADLARRCGGIMSGEHGDGRVRGPLLERFFGPELMRAFRDVKKLFDPQNILNPGNITEPGPIESITANLRVDAESGSGGTGSLLPVSNAGPARSHGLDEITYYNYSDSEGFGHAIEQCNGAGVCRKRGGVMCPSYQGLLDERHSTRGRGNALRLAITGQFAGFHGAGKPNWEDPDTIETLDLCLSCKACKSECPSNVDIARLKAEYTAQRYRQTQSIPIAALATGHVRVLNRLGSITPGLSNAVASSAPARAVINRIMRMHPKRTLPRFTKSLYRLAGSGAVVEGSAPTTPIAGDAPGLVLFTDCFTTYNESHIGLAAIRALRALGYNVSLSGSHCCGRSMISVGMLEQAIAGIDRAVEALRPAIEDDAVKAIIVCEPSCLSAITDDWLGLNCRSPLDLRKKLAAKAMLPEDFVDRYWDAHPRSPAPKLPGSPADSNNPSPVLFHAHCHQKSLGGAESSARLLKRLVGDRLRVLDTGCCGMAGSFGFDKKKYDLSMKIGELSLLPIVREAPEGAIIVATGTSCRHQIHDGAAGRRAIHPIELAAQLLG